MLDKEVRERFKEFKERTGEYQDLEIDDVRFEEKSLNDLHLKDKVKTKKNTTANKFIEIGDIDRVTKKYDISKKIKQNLPEKGKYAPKGSILISRVRPLLGGYTILDGDDYTFTSGDLNPIVLADNICVNYIFKIICSPKFETFLKRNQNTAGQKPTITSKLYDFKIPIPKDLNKTYTSFKIQEAIVAFLEDAFNKIEKMREFFDKRYKLIEKLDKALIPSTFMKEYVKISFGKYAKENDIGFDINDIEFEIKRIHSKNKDEVVCKKRMGFTPKNSASGTINWYSVRDLGQVEGLFIDSPNTFKKTTMNLIKQAVDKKNTGKSEKLIPIIKGDILISFKLTVGVVKIYNSEKPAYCNEAIDILTVYDSCDNRYVAYNCMLEYPKYGTKTNNGVTLNDDDKKLIQIFVPKDLENYTSLEIQGIIANFIEEKQNKIQDELDKMKVGYNTLERLNKAYLARTFTLIDWSVK